MMYKFQVLEENKILRVHDKERIVFSKQDIESQLIRKVQLEYLFRTGFISVRSIKESVEREVKDVEKVMKKQQKEQIKKDKEQLKKERESKKASKEIRLSNKLKLEEQRLTDLKKAYKTAFDEKKCRYELYRKNPKGYYNFISYFNDKLEEDEIIKQDIENQKIQKAKQKAELNKFSFKKESKDKEEADDDDI